MHQKIIIRYSLLVSSLTFGACGGGGGGDSGANTTPESPNETEYFISDNAVDKTWLLAERPDGQSVTIFADRDEEGSVTQLLGYSIEDADGNITRVENDVDVRPISAVAPDGTQFKIEWLSDSQIVVTTISPDGTYQSNEAFNLSEDNNESKSVGPAYSSSLTRLERVGHNPELLAHSCTALPARAQGKVVTSQNGASESIVTVERCGNPVENAVVDMLIAGSDAIEAQRLYGRNVGDGQFSFDIPTSETKFESTADAIESACNTAKTIASYGCLFSQQLVLASPLICSSISAAAASTGAGAALAPNLFAACEVSFAAFGTYCATVGAGVPGTDFQEGEFSLADKICNNIKGVLNGTLDTVAGETLTVTVTTSVTGEDPIIETNAFAASGPYPNFLHQYVGDPSVEEWSITPSLPEPFQDYVVDASIFCVESGTEITLNIAGTDGYSDSHTCIAQGDGAQQCSLTVPGAESDVRDTLSLTVDGVELRSGLVIF